MADNLEIKKFMALALNEGKSLSEIQNEINAAFGLKMTFMDVRILAAELEDIDWGANDPKPAEKKEPEAPKTGAADGKTVVESSKILRPGTLAGGTVKFGSGATAEWFIDQTGRPGLDNVGGEPTQQDIMDFQKELQALFSRGQ